MLLLLNKLFIGFHLALRETAVGADICYILSCLVGYSSFLVGPASHLLYSAQNTKRRVKVSLSVRTITFLDMNAVEYRIQSRENSGIKKVLLSVLRLILNRLKYVINYSVIVIVCVCNEFGLLYDCWV